MDWSIKREFEMSGKILLDTNVVISKIIDLSILRFTS
jgi:hypothetical protein